MGLLFRMKNFRTVIADLEFKHDPYKQGAMGSYANCMLLKPALIRRIKSCAYLFLKVSVHSIFRNVPTRLEAKHFICSLKRHSWITSIWSALNGKASGVSEKLSQNRLTGQVWCPSVWCPGLGDRQIIILTVMKRNSLPSH